MSTPLHVVHAIRSDGFAGVERSVVLTSIALRALGHTVTVIGGDAPMMRAQLDPHDVRWLPGASVAAVARALASVGRVDVVHAHMTAAELAALVARPVNQGRFVVTRHFAARRGTSRAGRLAAWAMARVAHTEIAISRYVADTIECPSVIVPHGLADVGSVAGVQRTIVVIQRLEAEKETDVALRAFAGSGLAADGWTMVVAGDGALRGSLERLAGDLGVGQAVRFLGRVADVDAVRAEAAIQLASPPTEHFGLSVLEAMACGLPVVAADGGAHRELLGDREELLFAPGDAEAAASRLGELATRDDRARIGRSLQARQREQFSLARHGELLERVYRTGNT